jgi:acyl-[acyl carrier protein]--UDP-N-acetylglucosamine O-acyltransferase
LREAYRILFRSGESRSGALETVHRDFGGVREVAHLAEFVAATKRGVARHGRESEILRIPPDFP